MMQVIPHLNKEKWNEIVKSFPNWDVYYLCEYATSFMIHGDGTPLLIYFKDNKCRVCYVVMLNDIANIDVFKGHIAPGKYFDFTTPYGYGGPIVDGNYNNESMGKFSTELNHYCIENNIITQFIRFHPLFQNQIYMEEICHIATFKETIAIDTSSAEIINDNMDSKNRNMIRKAKKMGVTIIQDKGERVEDFIQIYESTMENNKASKYYYFSLEYYEFLKNEMKNNVTFFYSCINQKIIGSATFFYNEQFMHYHLSGTLKEYRHMASTNLLLNKAALWASQRGIKYLHLGGGLGEADSLYKFKKQFNKNGHLSFYIGRTIFNKKVYNELLEIRKKIDSTFNTENSYLIQYRKE